jgi:HNH endonuclease
MTSWQGYGKNDGHILHAIATGELTADAATGHVAYRGRIVGSLTADGFVNVTIRRMGGFGWVSVGAHRICWMCWHAPIPPGMVIAHLNGRHWDNRAENLTLQPAPGKHSSLNRELVAA